jgi:hypothetical protein
MAIKTEVITIRVTPEQKQELMRMAEEANETLTLYIQRKVLDNQVVTKWYPRRVIRPTGGCQLVADEHYYDSI